MITINKFEIVYSYIEKCGKPILSDTLIKFGDDAYKYVLMEPADRFALPCLDELFIIREGWTQDYSSGPKLAKPARIREIYMASDESKWYPNQEPPSFEFLSLYGWVESHWPNLRVIAT